MFNLPASFLGRGNEVITMKLPAHDLADVDIENHETDDADHAARVVQ